jgi:hypothetical protein
MDRLALIQAYPCKIRCSSKQKRDYPGRVSQKDTGYNRRSAVFNRFARSSLVVSAMIGTTFTANTQQAGLPHDPSMGFFI